MWVGDVGIAAPKVTIVEVGVVEVLKKYQKNALHCLDKTLLLVYSILPTYNVPGEMNKTQ